METSTSPTTGYLAFVPGYFTRHANLDLDGSAACGAPAVPQGERRPVSALGVACAGCAEATG